MLERINRFQDCFGMRVPATVRNMAKLQLMNTKLILFLVLQLLDFATTLLAFAFGGGESNPLVAWFLSMGLVRGLLVSKVIVIGVACLGAAMRKERGIRWANVYFSAVVIWNLTIIGRLALRA